MMQMVPQSFSRHICDAGVAVHCANRLLVSSWLSHMMHEIREKHLVPVATFRAMKYDETPLTIRLIVDDEGPHVSDPYMRAMSKEALSVNRETGSSVTKLFQGSQVLAVLCKHVATQRLVSVEVPLTMPVLASDSSTADVLRIIMDKWQDLPLWQSLRALFPHNFEVTTCDGADSNLKLERQLYHERSLARWVQ